MLKLVKRVLERAGFECVAVGDGQSAHDAAIDWRPDIILLDSMLGTTTGEEILTELRKDFRTRLIPVVFLTVRSSLKDKVDHLLNGADDYVTKPFIPEELVARLRAVITRATTTRDLNPLTGMSGNSDILREITNRLVAPDRFAVLYPDIDAFKSYNDHYGFVRGDDVIKPLSTIILEVLEENPSKRHFAGHVGGDDFVILTEPNFAEPIAEEITKRFDASVPALYDLVDRERGWIEYEERNGNKVRAEFVSVSIGVVIAEAGSYASAAALAARAAEGKGGAQPMPGAKWVHHRRAACPPRTVESGALHEVRRSRRRRRSQPRAGSGRQELGPQGHPAIPRRRVDRRLHGSRPGVRWRRRRHPDPPDRAPAHHPGRRALSRSPRDAVRRRLDEHHRRRAATPAPQRHHLSRRSSRSRAQPPRRRFPRPPCAHPRRRPHNRGHACFLSRGAHPPRPLPGRGRHRAQRSRKDDARRHHPAGGAWLWTTGRPASRPLGQRDHGQRPR